MRKYISGLVDVNDFTKVNSIIIVELLVLKCRLSEKKTTRNLEA